jgi:D-serine deaminase-like pyridoxal phosphate-dependent protein
MFYPGHIREHVDEQDARHRTRGRAAPHVLDALGERRLEPGDRQRRLDARRVRIAPHHAASRDPAGHVHLQRPHDGRIGACDWDDCAYSVLATVVSTAVPGQAVVDAGSKALFREELRGSAGTGFGALLDRPDVVVKGMSEEHGLLDLSGTTGDRASGTVCASCRTTCASP